MDMAVFGKLVSIFLSSVTNGMAKSLAKLTNSQSYAEQPLECDRVNT